MLFSNKPSTKFFIDFIIDLLNYYFTALNLKIIKTATVSLALASSDSKKDNMNQLLIMFDHRHTVTYIRMNISTFDHILDIYCSLC